MSGTGVTVEPKAGPTRGLELIVKPLSGSALVRDYLAGADALAPFYAGHPFASESYLRKAAEVASRLDPAQRRAVSPALRPTSARAAERLEAVLSGAGLAVTTGQQAGLFGGPLYTIHKILSAIRLAGYLEDVLGRVVLPFFWVAADDHDWAEVNHASVLTAQNDLEELVLPDDPAVPPVSMARRRLGSEVEAVRDALFAALPRTEFSQPLIELVTRSYRPGTTHAAAFSELLAGLLSEFDLVLIDPSHLALKRNAAPILGRELTHVDHHTRLLERQTARLEAAGYPAQVTIAPGVSNVFYEDENGRDRLVAEHGGWVLRKSRRRLADSELRTGLAERPEYFSANVLLRPVVESALFPTVAYVAGPSEIAYFAQIGCLFHAHGIEPPVVHPRFGVTIVEGKVRKVLDKFGMSVDDFERPFHEVAAKIVRDEMPERVSGALESLRIAMQEGFDRLADAGAEVDPTLRGWLESTRNTVLGQLDAAEKKIASHQRKRSEVELEQVRKAAVNLYPHGRPQERVLNPLPYLARYGTELLVQLAEAMVPAIEANREPWSGVRC